MKLPEPVKVPAIDIAASACANYHWKNRGRAPLAYITGMVKMFKKHCHDKPMELGLTDKDALAYYGLPATQLNTYALLMGLGMRESSGKYCTGYDVSAGKPTPTGAEAGMFQFSANSQAADLRLKPLVRAYVNDNSKCELETFSPHVTCSPQSIIGSGSEAEFQKLSKSCPAFAVEYAEILIRKLRRHFGPLNRKEAEVVPACVELLKSSCQ